MHQDPFDISPDDRFREIAAILARGILRLRKHGNLRLVSPPEKSGNSPAEPLAVPADPRLSVTTG